MICLQTIIQFFELSEDPAHLENGVVAALRGRTMGADPFYRHLDFHPTPLATVYPAIGRFGRYHEFRFQI